MSQSTELLIELYLGFRHYCEIQPDLFDYIIAKNDDNNVIRVIEYLLEYGIAEICSIVVHENHRNKGIEEL